MKTLIKKVFLIVIVIVTFTSCYKTYVCHCVIDPNGTISDSTAMFQVDARSKEKAMKLCEQSSCGDGKWIVD